MNIKKLKIPFLILLIIISVAGIIYIPKIKSAFAFKEAMELKNLEHTFINMDENLPIKIVEKARQPFVFPHISNIALPADFVHKGTSYNTLKYIDSSYTQGFLFIQNDTIQYENYWRGQQEDTRHVSWSMAKSYVSALFGIAIEEGYIKSIDQVVDAYLPELKGSGYEGVKIKDVLQMSSGVKFNEDYSDPDSDINQYFKGFILGDSQNLFAASLVNEIPPGTFNRYVSIDTHVLGMIIVKATGKSLTDYLQEKIWKPITNFHPFILVSNAKSLNKLKEYGFKTFEPFIDESYDNINDKDKRFLAICREIEKLCNKPIEEIHEWYWSIEEILKHNYYHFYNEFVPNEKQRFLNEIQL